MKFIKSNEAVKRSNSENCSVLEYPLDDQNVDLALAEIIGRYPEKVKNWCMYWKVLAVYV